VWVAVAKLDRKQHYETQTARITPRSIHAAGATLNVSKFSEAL
jgi:hypothetical protein